MLRAHIIYNHSHIRIASRVVIVVFLAGLWLMVFAVFSQYCTRKALLPWQFMQCDALCHIQCTIISTPFRMHVVCLCVANNTNRYIFVWRQHATYLLTFAPRIPTVATSQHVFFFKPFSTTLLCTFSSKNINIYGVMVSQIQKEENSTSFELNIPKYYNSSDFFLLVKSWDFCIGRYLALIALLTNRWKRWRAVSTLTSKRTN